MDSNIVYVVTAVLHLTAWGWARITYAKLYKVKTAWWSGPFVLASLVFGVRLWPTLERELKD